MPLVETTGDDPHAALAAVDAACERLRGALALFKVAGAARSCRAVDQALHIAAQDRTRVERRIANAIHRQTEDT